MIHPPPPFQGFGSVLCRGTGEGRECGSAVSRQPVAARGAVTILTAVGYPWSLGPGEVAVHPRGTGGREQKIGRVGVKENERHPKVGV